VRLKGRLFDELLGAAAPNRVYLLHWIFDSLEFKINGKTLPAFLSEILLVLD